MTIPGRKRIAVVGGGLSGMATALLLTRNGCEVTLVEKKRKLGATLRGFFRQGVQFDTGLHYAGGFEPDGPLTRYFRLLGLESLPLADFNEDCFDRVRFAGSSLELLLPVGLQGLTDVLSAAFPADAAFIRVYLRTVREHFLASPFVSFAGDFSKLMQGDGEGESLASVLRKGTGNAALRAALSIHTLLYGVSPEETSFAQHARVAGSYLDGVKTVAGGGKALVEALEKRLKAEGVTVVLGSGVARVLFSGREAESVVLEDERSIAVDGVVFTAHPSILPGMLPEGAVKPAFARRLLSLEDTVSSYTLFCASEASIDSLRGSNIFVCPEGGVEAGFRPERDPLKVPYYISGSGRDAAGRSGGIILFAPGAMAELDEWRDTKTGSRPASYAAFKTERLAGFRAAAAESCPELAAVTVLDGGTPLTNRDFLGSPGGGLYGAKHSLHQFNPLPFTRVPNLWMAGQSVAAPGLLGTVVSAAMVCGVICGMETIRKEMTACV